MHDDQHGTAIISAVLAQRARDTGKRIEDVLLVVNGVSAAAVSCTKLYIAARRKEREHRDV